MADLGMAPTEMNLRQVATFEKTTSATGMAGVGPWTEISASTINDADHVAVQPYCHNGAAWFSVQLGVGPAGQEVAITSLIANKLLHEWTPAARLLLPVNIKKGSRLCIRGACSVTVTTVGAYVALYRSPPNSQSAGGAIFTVGLTDMATSMVTGTVLPGNGTYIELTSSMPRHMRRGYLQMQSRADALEFSGIDLGIGPAGSERVFHLGTSIHRAGWAASKFAHFALEVPFSIARGTRVAARSMGSFNNNTPAVSLVGIG